ncbi:MAG: ABC transporter ATP-binding protein [Muribaculaceae bacterium]|nr:ABC transporter ATP-binding protein [Roseburia sp.]MCM1431162.1 ABC transporter ATP-binding protein [Muribaculaceae bacterium]MCM1492585.1 ABC transporter ATP-binding protein [Muribaculaceae bacterium]
MLQIDHLYKSYGKFLAVNNLTLHIPEGDLFGFVGPNGAGKTTTIRMVCGLMPQNAGSITINGVDVSNQKEIKRQIGYVPDFFGVYDNLKVKEYMDFYGSMYSMNSRDIGRIADDLLALVNLSDKKEVYVDTLSRGMKQRLCVARALIHNPSLLVLDEPNSGLDPRARVEMKELLLNLKSMGKTIVISSHILSELSEMCNSIGIMNHGSLVAAGRIEDVMENVFGSNGLVITTEGGMDTAVRIAKEHSGVKIESVGENELKLTHSMTKEQIAKMIGEMIAGDVVVTGFRKQEGNLETLFMQVTGGEENANANESNR